MQDTRREVEQYLARGRTRLNGLLLLYAKAPVAIGITVASWAVLVFVQPGLVVGLLCLAGLSLGALLTAFCVQHDANHGAYFRRRRHNHLLGWSADALLGFSSYAWRVKHNVAHHTYTNIDGFDDDAKLVPLARFAPSQTPKPWYRFQHLYIWPMYTLMGLRLQTIGDISVFLRGRVGESTLRAPRGWNLAGVIGRQGDLRHVGDRDPAARVPLVGRARRLPRFRDGHEPDHGDDVPARTLRRGGIVHVGRAGARQHRRSGPSTRSNRPSISVLATPCSPGCSAASTSRSSTTCSRSFRIPTTRRSPRSCGATAPSTESATRRSRRSEPRCARTSSISARWAASAFLWRSRWGSDPYKASRSTRIAPIRSKPRRSRIGADIAPAPTTRRGAPRSTASSHRAWTSDV